MATGEKGRRFFLVPPSKLKVKVVVAIDYSPTSIVVRNLPLDVSGRVRSLGFHHDVNTNTWIYRSNDRAAVERVYNELLSILNARGNVVLWIARKGH